MLTQEYFKQYFKRDLPKYSLYAESVKISNDLKIHSKGKYSIPLMEVARPNEAQEYKDYRKAVFKSVTKPYYGKVVNVISKGKRAEDWSITFPKQVTAEGESLEDYTQKNYPTFDSLENWFFSVGLNTMLEDPNAVVAIFPKTGTTFDNEYNKPFTEIFESEYVLDFQENHHCTLLSKEKSIVRVGKDDVKEGRIIYFIDKGLVRKFEQYGQKDDFTFNETWAFEQKSGYMPAFKIGGFIESFENGQILYKSFISDALDAWDESLRRYSDHQVNMVLHLHPYEWEIADSECATCKGKGVVGHRGASGYIESDCKACHGAGKTTTRTPFGRKLIKPAAAMGVNNNVAIPTPPAGIVERDIASIDFLKKEYKDKIKEGLSALNMEFVMDEPELNSGVAKVVDRQELNNYVGTVYRHIVENILIPSYYFIAHWRYEGIADDVLPVINVPSKFDLLTSDVLANRLKTAKDGKFASSILNKLEMDYAKKEFGDDSRDAKIMQVVAELDPLPNKTEDEKMVILGNGGVTKEDYILSCMLPSFIIRAINENEKFFELRYKDQHAQLMKYVKEVEGKAEALIIPINDGQAA